MKIGSLGINVTAGYQWSFVTHKKNRYLHPQLEVLLYGALSIFPPSNDFYSYLEDGKVHIVYRYPHNPEDEWNDCKNIYSDTEVKASVQPEVSSRR